MLSQALVGSTHVVLMRDDMASGSVSRSLNGKTKRSLHKVRERGPKSSIDSMEDSSRESSVASSVSGRISRKQPAAPQPLESPNKKKKKHHVTNGETIYRSPMTNLSYHVPKSSGPRVVVESDPISRPVIPQTQMSKKKMKKRSESTDVPQNSKSVDVILQQLKDGIDSNDNDTIFRILDENDPKIVTETVNHLPVEFVSRLLEFLKKKICRKTVKTANSLLWLNRVLQSKLTFLLSLPGAKSAIAPLADTLNTRIEVFDCVLKLKGRLNLLNAQAVDQKPQSKISSKPAVVEFESEESSGGETDECIAMESFSTNQLNHIGPNSSDEEIHPDNSEQEEGDDESD